MLGKENTFILSKLITVEAFEEFTSDHVADLKELNGSHFRNFIEP